jgi:hypothetical protein
MPTVPDFRSVLRRAVAKMSRRRQPLAPGSQDRRSRRGWLGQAAGQPRQPLAPGSQ